MDKKLTSANVAAAILLEVSTAIVLNLIAILIYI